ncbi:MAG: DUF1588 domain-containing protein, partial [Gemmatimonadetes bacterium]|nr:DUF1588 domain-containing protein [Gemmatimonadota bacterium]
PPAPPPDVPPLPDRGEDDEPASVRERLELHRRDPVCASCHASIDPPGFMLENYDAIGGWRSVTEAGRPVDAVRRRGWTCRSGRSIRDEGHANRAAPFVEQVENVSLAVLDP